MILKNNEYRQLEFERRTTIGFFNRTVYIVSAEDLLLSKLIWIQELQSSIQMEDIKSLIQVENLDWNYINNWLSKLNLNTFKLI